MNLQSIMLHRESISLLMLIHSAVARVLIKLWSGEKRKIGRGSFKFKLVIRGIIFRSVLLLPLVAYAVIEMKLICLLSI